MGVVNIKMYYDKAEQVGIYVHTYLKQCQILYVHLYKLLPQNHQQAHTYMHTYVE
jgi:hypothetical protein